MTMRYFLLCVLLVVSHFSSILGADSNKIIPTDPNNLLKMISTVSINAGWERRTRFKLHREGKQNDEINKIIKEEKKKILASNNNSLEEKISNFLEIQGITGSYLKESIKAELAILFEISALDSGSRSKAMDDLHTARASKYLRTASEFKNMHHNDILKIAKDWKFWLLKGSTLRQKFLTSLSQSLSKKRKASTEKMKQEEAAYKKISNSVHNLLSSKGLSGLNYDTVFKKELEYGIKLLSLPEAERDNKNNIWHIEDTISFIKEHNIINEKLTDVIQKLAEDWKSSYYNGTQNRINSLRQAHQNLKQIELDKLRDKWIILLAEKNLKDEDLIVVLNRELAAQRLLLDFPLKERESYNHDCHMSIAKDIIADCKPKMKAAYVAKIASDWEKWFYQKPNQHSKTFDTMVHILDGGLAKELEGDIRAKLIRKKLTGKILKDRLTTEVDIALKAMSVTPQNRSKLVETLYQEAAKKILEDSNFFKLTPADFPDTLKSSWKSWFYLPNVDFEKEVLRKRKSLESKRKLDRRKYASEIISKTRQQMDQHWTNNINSAKNERDKAMWISRYERAMKNFYPYWASIQKVSRRSYFEQVDKVKTILRDKDGYTEQAIKIFVNGLDEFYSH